MHLKTERTCIACKNKNLQNNLNRIVFKENQIYFDNEKQISGRAVYVCNNKDCVNKVIKNKLLNKSFKTNIDEKEYQKLLNN